MKIGAFLDIGHYSAGNAKVIIEGYIQMGDLAIGLINPHRSLQFL